MEKRRKSANINIASSKKGDVILGVVIAKKRYMLALLILAFIFSSCANGERNVASNETGPAGNSGDITGIYPDSQTVPRTGTIEGARQQGGSTGDAGVSADSTYQADEKADDDGTPEETGSEENKGMELLQSASVDLDGDGNNEQVEVLQVELPPAETGMQAMLEGRLAIKGTKPLKILVFRKKAAGDSQMLSGMHFEDMDGDGAKDVFLIIPDHGASFSYSGYFMYSCKKDLSYTFMSDNMLADFIGGFEAEHVKGTKKIRLANRKINFSADLEIEYFGEGEPDEKTMADFARRTWIDPVSVDISDKSRLAVVHGPDGKPEIKVPLPIFGSATINLIGELDLFFAVDDDFKPVLKRFEVLDFNGSEFVKTGAGNAKGW